MSEYRGGWPEYDWEFVVKAQEKVISSATDCHPIMDRDQLLEDDEQL